MNEHDDNAASRALLHADHPVSYLAACLKRNHPEVTHLSRHNALWDGDSKALRASLDRIANTARDIIDDVGGQSARKAVA